ncbi:hypothetical protein ACQCVP_16820 [Rossellomorea vietnamensis]|uniref:hypothetical protein n=1 Tax=Rossellomorea vietnamensis TaxID=218284 RepID=UPI003CF0B234
MFRIEKKVVFPFARCGLLDSEGLGAGTRRPLVLQEIVRQRGDKRMLYTSKTNLILPFSE